MKGFILTELIIVIGLVAVFLGISVFGFSNLETYFLSRSSKGEVLSILDRTRNLAISMYQNDGWSVKSEGNKLTIYKGGDYNNRDSNFDETYELSSKTVVSNDSDIYFEPMTGFSNFSTTTVTVSNSSYNIFVSNNGIIR